MKDERNRILGDSDWAGRNQDGGRKGEGSIGIANTKVCQRCTEILRIGKLLPLIY